MEPEVYRPDDIPAAVLHDIVLSIQTGQPQGFVWVMIVLAIGGSIAWIWRQVSGRA